MKELGKPQLTSDLPSDPRWELTQRVADSTVFRNCPKLRAFLLYVCENALLGRPENVREQLIGSKVFGRTPDYNISEDNIVRVEARELRKRLEAYFVGEGKNEPAVIEIPKGGYVAVFRARPSPRSSSNDAAAAAPPAARPGWLPSAFWIAVVLLVCVSVWLGVILRQTSSRERELLSGRAALPAADESRYSELLGSLGHAPNREALLVLSNPKVVLYYASDSKQPIVEGSGRTVPAPKHLKESFGDALNNVDRELPFQFLHLTREDYTGMGEAVSAFHVGQLMQSLRRPVRLTQGRFLNWDQVQKQDLIVLGAPQINDWTNQNIVKSGFNLVFRAIENAQPAPGEQKRYAPEYEPGTAGGVAITDYAFIKMLTSPSGFRMLVVAGLTSAGTAGAGAFFASPEKMRPVFDSIRSASAGKPFPSDWEVLIKVKIRDGLALDSTVVAVRPAAGR